MPARMSRNTRSRVTRPIISPCTRARRSGNSVPRLPGQGAGQRRIVDSGAAGEILPEGNGSVVLSVAGSIDQCDGPAAGGLAQWRKRRLVGPKLSEIPPLECRPLGWIVAE